MINHAEVVQRIRRANWRDKIERERIIAKNFPRTRPIISYLRQKYNFGATRVLDIGSGFGDTLLYWGPDSEGIDIVSDVSSLPEALGYTIHHTNVEDSLLPPETSPFDRVFSANLIEHLVAPHLFLGRVRDMLADNGILALGHPTVSPLRHIFGQKLQYRGYASSEHINFFTPTTVALMLERAGFEIIEQVVPRRHFVLRRALWTAPVVYSICRRVPGWKYPSKRAAAFDPQFASLDHYH